jgi:hypothetical protein
MSPRKVIIIAAAVVVGFVGVTLCIRSVNRSLGADEASHKIGSLLATHGYILRLVGSPASITVQRDEPSRVERDWKSNRRDGFFTVTATGPKGTESLKAFWAEGTAGAIDVYAIYRTAPWKQDVLIWGTPRRDPLTS